VGRALVADGVLAADDVERIDREARARFQAAYERTKQGAGHDEANAAPRAPGAARRADATAVPAERLAALQAELLTYPTASSRTRSSQDPRAPRRGARRQGRASSGGRRSSSRSRRS
jgi:2-oxoglutarate dehydrogenase complex dehydrogenase (E1) component-like enzyme